MSKKGFGKFLVGGAIGAALGVLFAPKKGEATRKELKIKIDELLIKVKDLDSEDVKTELENKIHEIKEELNNLDKEEVLKIAKAKGKEALKKAEELLEYAIEKGTPFLEKAAAEMKDAVKQTVEDILKKFEEEEKETK